MATRPGKEAPGKRDRAGAAPKVTDETKCRPNDPRNGAGAAGRNPQAGPRPSTGSGSTFAEIALRQHDEREDGETGQGSGRTGPRRVLIFARTLKEACDIAKRKKYPRDLWRFVTSIADTDVDPREWATITVPGFGKDRPFAKDAYDLFQARCRGFGIKVPSYDP